MSCLLATTSLACASSAKAQDTQTESYGERYDYVETFEYGLGSTTYQVEVTAEIGGQQVVVADLFRYFAPHSLDEIAQAVPGSFDYDIGGATVTVTAWSAPEHVDGWYDVTGYFFFDSHSYNWFDETSVQVTSGDAPDALVPIGYRGNCSDGGTSGETNFGNFGGAFAACEGADDYFSVAPGTLNTNTHTTFVYEERYYAFESADDGYFDFYRVRPAASLTSSSGTLERFTSSTETIRNDLFQVNITGMVGADALFSEALAGQVADAAVRTRLAALSRPIAYAANGAPAVVVWSAPARTGSSSVLSSSTAATQVESSTSELVTVTTTLGGLAGGNVMLGERGTCTTTGSSGSTNGAAPTGSFASCEGGVSYLLGPDEINTNTHTTTVETQHTATLVTENWLNTDSWLLQGTPVLVGPIHAAVRDTLFDGAGAAARKQAGMLGSTRGPVDVWFAADFGWGGREAGPQGPGSETESREILGGITFSPSGAARFGLALGHSASRLRLKGLAERADVDLTQLAVAARFRVGPWDFRLSAGHGWADLRTDRGSAALGGFSRADYSASTWHASAEAGPSFDLGQVTLRPVAGAEWTRARLGAFAETGGIGLGAPAETANRAAVTLGVLGAVEWSLAGDSAFTLWTDLRGGRVVNGDARERGVFFLSDPAMPLRVASAAEGRSYADASAGMRIATPWGFGVHLGGQAHVASGSNGWRAGAGVNAAF